MRIKICFVGVLFACVLGAVPVTQAATVATTVFPTTDLSDTDSLGFWTSAEATIRTGAGYVEVELTNTSPRQDNFQIGIETGSANPFIMEMEINLGTYSLNQSLSYVQSTTTALISSGVSNPASLLGQQNLYYEIVAADTPGMSTCFMFGEGTWSDGDAGNDRNDNAIASLNALNATDYPLEDFATGWLNASPETDSGAIFDTAIFRFGLNTAITPDADYWSQDNVVIKFIGGGDYSIHVTGVPEPATIMLLGLGGLLLRKRSKA